MRIGGLFPVKLQDKHPAIGISYPAQDSRWMMSGRCGILLALTDWLVSTGPAETSLKKRVYLPAYTCETVVASFKKLGLHIDYYPLDTDLRAHFESDKLFASDLCLFTAYYGRETYQEAFLDEERISSFTSLLEALQQAGVTIFFDLTHSLLNANPLPALWDYAAGSFRKWMGVYAGGFALKREGNFQVVSCPAHKQHISLRKQALAIAGKLEGAQDGEVELLRQECDAAFWAGENLLRSCFDLFESDQESLEILQSTDFAQIRKIRRDNYHFLAEKMPKLLEAYPDSGLKIIFPSLEEGEVPSHFSLLVETRDSFREKMQEWGVKTSVYWPILEDLPTELRAATEEITDHIVSLPCDQRYDRQDMTWILCALADYLDQAKR